MGLFTPRIRKAQQERNIIIRRQYKTGKFTYQDLADFYKISRQRIAQIIHYSKQT